MKKVIFGWIGPPDSMGPTNPSNMFGVTNPSNMFGAPASQPVKTATPEALVLPAAVLPPLQSVISVPPAASPIHISWKG